MVVSLICGRIFPVDSRVSFADVVAGVVTNSLNIVVDFLEEDKKVLVPRLEAIVLEEASVGEALLFIATVAPDDVLVVVFVVVVVSRLLVANGLDSVLLSTIDQFGDEDDEDEERLLVRGSSVIPARGRCSVDVVVDVDVDVNVDVDVDIGVDVDIDVVNAGDKDDTSIPSLLIVAETPKRYGFDFDATMPSTSLPPTILLV